MLPMLAGDSINIYLFIYIFNFSFILSKFLLVTVQATAESNPL